MNNRVKCPYCGYEFVVEDPHRPFRCPKCGSLLDLYLGRPRLLMTIEEIMKGERA